MYTIKLIFITFKDTDEAYGFIKYEDSESARTRLANVLPATANINKKMLGGVNDFTFSSVNDEVSNLTHGCGMVNVNNTCYINAALQALLHTSLVL